jgi:LysM repeat protein
MNYVRNNAYTFLLIIFLFIGTIILINSNEDPAEYITIQINEGDTLWNIAQEYEEYTSYSTSNFIKWVKLNNNSIHTASLTIGKKIIIPVKKSELPLEIVINK